MRSVASAATFPAADPDRQIDHVLVRGDLRATAPAESVRLPLSDHRALVVDCAASGEILMTYSSTQSPSVYNEVPD